MRRFSTLKLRCILTLGALCLSAFLGGCGTVPASNDVKDDHPPATDISVTDEKVSLILWGAEEDLEMLGDMVEDFYAIYPNVSIEILPVGEDKAKDTILKGEEAPADVFAIAHDQLGELVENGKLCPIFDSYVESISNSNLQASVNAATEKSVLYGFPFSAETYIMYYDKSVFSSDVVESLESMLECATENGKAIGFDMDNNYFTASFYLTYGVKLFGLDGKSVDGSTFNSEEAINAANYIAGLAEKGMLNIDDSESEQALRDGTISAYITGAWRTNQFKKALGSNYAAQILPTIETDSGARRMISFAGYKLYVVNSETEYPEEAMALADFLSCEESQTIRFDKRALLPSNTNAGKNPNLSTDSAVLATINQLFSSVTMPCLPEIANFWTEDAMNMTLDIFNGEISPEDFPDVLEKFNQSLSKVVSH